MSAIWGAVSLDGNDIPEEYGRIFHKRYQDFAIDKTEVLCSGLVIMGCELQYFSGESEKERLPWKGEDGLCFVADVYLDNREELLKDPLFEKEKAGGNDQKEEIPDGEILRRYYEKYGTEGLNRLRGSYAFVSYDPSKRVISMAVDHMANRCLYYAIVDGIFYFSTLMDPIAWLNQGKLHPNRKVFEDFLVNQDMRVYLDHEATVFSEIRHAVAGELQLISKDNVERIDYWEPLKHLKTFSGKSDETYERELRGLLDQAVKRAMRTPAEIGIFLSSGLDSTAVACIAAPLLKKKGKKLFSYTMVPVEGYLDDTGERVNVDERELVRETARFLGNVEERYESFPDINAWDCMEKQADLLEGPFKSMQNVLTLGELGRMARNDGCRIVLNGQLGNDTISYGDTDGYLYELFRKGRWISLWKETGSHSKYFRYNRKKVLGQILERMLWKEPHVSYERFCAESIVQGYSKSRYETLTRSVPVRTRKEYLKLILDKMRFRQIGDNETRTSLYAGILIKDPTRDVDLMEWCLRLPSEQFNKNCTNRRLVYEYLSDVITPRILDQRLPKGRQSADEFFRLESRKEAALQIMKDAFEREECPVIDREKILARLEENRSLFGKKTETEEERKQLSVFLRAYEACILWKKYFGKPAKD